MAKNYADDQREDYTSLVTGYHLSMEDRSFVDNLFYLLREKLGFDNCQPVSGFERRFKRFSKRLNLPFLRMKMTEWETKDMISRILYYLRLDESYLNLVFQKANIYQTGPAGHFVPTSVLGGTITIRLFKGFDFPIYFAVAIHECMHYYFHCHEIYFNNAQEEEWCADMAAVYFGFGRYLLKGYQEYTQADKYFFEGTRTIRVGYLTIPELAYAENNYAIGMGK